MKSRKDATPERRADSTRELIRARALERGQQRSADTRVRVETAMRAIEQEMASNEGIYPSNKGAVSAAEVARRAGVHTTTFFSPKQRELGDTVRDWLKTLKERNVVGAGPVKRTLSDRVADWKDLYNRLAQSHRDTELELQQTEADLEKACERIDELTSERDALLNQLAKSEHSSVVPLRPKKR
jgi:hypothetical protein